MNTEQKGDGETAGHLTEKILRSVPNGARHLLTPVQMFVRVYATPDGWRCPSCGVELLHEEQAKRDRRGYCRGCDRPLARRCENKLCGEGVEPVFKYGVWYDDGAHCAKCTSDSARRARLSQLMTTLPKKAIVGAAAWQPDVAWRNQVSGIATSWGHNMRGISAVMLSGPTGTGKTVAEAFMVKRVFGDYGAVRDFAFCREKDLLEANAAQFYHGDEAWAVERARAAVKLLNDALNSPLFVIDEFAKGGAGRYTPAQHERMWHIITHRLDNNLLTVFGTNMPTHVEGRSIFSLLFDSNGDGSGGATIDSRWQTCGAYIDANGRDRRADS